MDNSQSSDFLSESIDMFCNSPSDPVIMDTTYESLVYNTKRGLTNIRKEIKTTSFSTNFSTLLGACSTCISQNLDLITDLLTETNLKPDKLIDYMNDAVCLLQSLSDLLKTIVESISLSCCSMKSFPTVTGRIIMLVFIHCKDSETLYGSQLNFVEKQLKDLFRTCHELQLTYLMVLEKHFIFDFTKKEEQDILIEALDINLKIGEIVQSLDVKTMAEQWKAYTMICDKYSNYLIDKKIYSDCTKILCSMITNNIRTALEENQEEKIVLRSLKVSSFTLKILMRVCNTFRQAVVSDYEGIVELLLYLHLYNEAYLQTMFGKSLQFINLFNNNITSLMNSLLSELLVDEKLLFSICNYEVSKIAKDNKLLGLILLVISVIRIIVQKSADQTSKVRKDVLINAVYSFLPYCHIWCSMGLRFRCDKSTRQYQTYGLYEHLLTHFLALAATMGSEEVNVLEKKMIEAVLSTDCFSALFSSNLWMLLSRMANRQFLLSQVISLCKVYQKLESNHNMFAYSPQKIHLKYTISSLYEIMHTEDKMIVYKMFITDDENVALWSCLKLCNVPDERQRSNTENTVMEKFRIEMENLSSTENCRDIDALINIINLASTCSIVNREDEMENLLITAWTKACPNNMQHIAKTLGKGTVWYYRYIEALVQLTYSMEHVFYGNSTNLLKVLHNVSKIVQSGSKELKLLLIHILCKLATLETNDMNKHLVESIISQTFRELFQDTDLIVKNKLYVTLRMFRTNALDRMISKIASEDDTVRETWAHFVRHGRLKREIDLKEQLLFTVDNKYCHKCIANGDVFGDSGSVNMQKSLSNNFDFVDIDSLFDADSDAEPALKKTKLNTNEVEQIINRLETDVSLLCNIKENIFSSEYKNRIKNVCYKLNNIID